MITTINKPLNSSTSSDYIIHNLNNIISLDLNKNATRWINDEKATIPFNLQSRYRRKKFGPNFGHFSTPITVPIAGCKIVIDKIPYVVMKIEGDGTAYGSVYLNANPPIGRVTSISSLEFTNEGLQQVFSDDSIYTPSRHGDLCLLDFNGTVGNTLGSVTIGTKNYRINESSMIIGSYSYNSRIIKVENSTYFSIGQEIFIHQTQHTDLTRVGLYSYNYIQDINYVDHTIILKFPLGELFETTRFNALDSVVSQIVTVPHYQELTIESSGSITCNPWNGKSGGIIVFRVQNSLINNGYITASGCGFRGGIDYAKRWAFCPGSAQKYPTIHSNIEPTGGEGCCGIDSNYGFVQPEPEFHYGSEYPIIDPNNPNCYAYNNIQNQNQRLQYGGGGYRVISQGYYNQPRVVTGYGPGAGGGSYTAGEQSKSASNRCCGWSGGYCTWRYADFTAPGGFKIENDRTLAINFGCGGASGAFRYPHATNIKYYATGGNGGGIILINATSIINDGIIEANGSHGTLNMKSDPTLSSFDISSAGGGGSGQIYLNSISLLNKNNISAIGGPGYHLLFTEWRLCTPMNSKPQYETHTYSSGKGGDGHIAYISKDVIDSTKFNCAKLEYIDRIYDYRMCGLVPYDYRLTWPVHNVIYTTQSKQINVFQRMSVENYILNYNNRNDNYKSIDQLLYGIELDSVLYNYQDASWVLFDPNFDDLSLNHQEHILLTSEQYLKSPGIDSKTKFMGSLFAINSIHQIYSPLIISIDYIVKEFGYNIWGYFKMRDINTVSSKDFNGLMNNK